MRSAVLPLLLMSFLFLAGCGSSEVLLGTIGNEKIPLSEYEEMFIKNNGGWEKAAASSMEDRKDFLNLFVKYKLKLLEAKNRGLEKDTAVLNELQSYRSSMAASYVLEREMIEPGLHRLYDRRKFDLKASHILIRVNPNATPAETLAAYTKAKDLIQRAETTSFDSLARGYSQDPGSGPAGGELGWFTQGRMVKEFEDAAYSLKPGEITKEPVRTRFGYHIIKLTAREPNQGSLTVAHVLFRFGPGLTDTASVRDTVNNVYRLMEEGKLSFADAVSRYSQDPSSKSRGGEIGTYERASLPEQISSILMKTPVDSIAQPFRAPYGYHIFKILAKHPLPDFEEMKTQLRQQYQQQQYSKDYEDYVAALNKRYQLNFDVKLRQTLVLSLDSTKTSSTAGWKDNVDSSMMNRTLFTYASKKFTVMQFLNRLAASPEFNQEKLTPKNVDDIIDRLAESTILEEHDVQAESRHPEFKTLMDEYEKGVLIFRMDQDAVWEKAVVTDSTLQAYYDSTREQWRLPDRVNIAEVYVPTDSLANVLYRKILKGSDFGDIARQYTTRQGYKEKKGEWGLRATTTNDLTEAAATMAVDSISKPIKFYDGWSIIKVLAKEPSRVKTFEEAKPDVTRLLQNNRARQLEETWIDALRKKYKVELNEDVLSQAFKRKPREGS